ncbi:MAG: hypothetical protein IPP79_14830 [Chitinophagaceae bacterium]|nr:hypothetical protein [Chitinophagaceae bacterium]
MNVCLHEVGHNFSLPHCSNKTCVMVAANGDFRLIPLGDFAVIVSKPCIKKGGNMVSPPQLIHNTLKTRKKKRVKIFVFIKFLYLCLPKKWG